MEYLVWLNFYSHYDFRCPRGEKPIKDKYWCIERTLGPKDELGRARGPTPIVIEEKNMHRSHYLMVPISGQGIVVDPGMKPILQKAMMPPLGYSDVFIYSHGWWTWAKGADNES
jgi:hypothetical protein